MKVAICDYKNLLTETWKLKNQFLKNSLETQKISLYVYMKVIMRNLKKQLKM